MEKLEILPSITRISENVVRVLGQNPGKFTLQGTNTYIIGKQNPHILIDTGEGLEEYIPVLESALREIAPPTNSTQPDVSDIIISHWHHDHVGGLPTVLTLLHKLWKERNGDAPYSPPRLHKYPIPQGTKIESINNHHAFPSIIDSLPHELYTPASTGAFHDLHDSQPIGSSSLQVLHTPGHTVDSICLHIPDDRALYTADTVLGQGTAVFEDLSTYMNSLNKMLNFSSPSSPSGESYVQVYPAHGPIIPNGKEIIAMYIKHRLEREAQVLQVLKTEALVEDEAEGYWTTWTIVKKLYAAYPESLWLPAARGIDLHLRKLEVDGLVKQVGGEGKDIQWTIVLSTSTPAL
ncbi:lactamase [Cyathus striatus]|nr:lactamase [Cyathus striatus]